jgi:hypothetical protein
MKRNRQKKSLTVSNSRWLAYAAAGAATTLGGAYSAEAEIHYSGLVNAKFSGDTSKTFPLTSTRGLFFSHRFNYYSPSNKTGGNAFVAGVSVAGFFTCTYTSNKSAAAYNLTRGESISERPFFSGKAVLATAEGANCHGAGRGEFLLAGVGFIGFKFNVGDGDQYGWARIEAFGVPRNRFRLVDYAYGDPGDRVKVGQKSGGHSPGLESLSALTLGAAGLMAWRKHRTQTTP